MRSPVVLIMGIMAGMGFSMMTVAEPLVVLRTVGSADQEVITRVKDWVGANIGQVHCEGELKANGTNLQEIVRAVPQPKTPQRVLILVNDLKGESRHIAQEGPVVAILLGIMKVSDMKSEKGRETFMRRVEKESVGALAASYGLPACPMIRCAAYAASTTVEVDEKSRSLCPPCMQKLEEILGERR